MNNLNVDNLKKVYTSIVRRGVNQEFTINSGGANLRTIQKLLSSLEQEYGAVSPERLVDFCVCVAHAFKGRPKHTIKQAFGKASLERFRNNTKSHRYYEDRWLSEIGLNRKCLMDLVVVPKKHPLAQYVYIPSEDHTKKRMLNQEVGYVICQNSTLGWSPRSPVCQQCEFVERCKLETQKNYPEIYRIRLEDYGTHS